MEVDILGASKDEPFSNPYLYKVTSDDVGKTPSDYLGQWYFIDVKNYTIGRELLPYAGSAMIGSQPRMLAASARMIATSAASRMVVSPTSQPVTRGDGTEPKGDAVKTGVPPLSLNSVGTAVGLAAPVLAGGFVAGGMANTEPQTTPMKMEEASPTPPSPPTPREDDSQGLVAHNKFVSLVDRSRTAAVASPRSAEASSSHDEDRRDAEEDKGEDKESESESSRTNRVVCIRLKFEYPKVPQGIKDEQTGDVDFKLKTITDKVLGYLDDGRICEHVLNYFFDTPLGRIVNSKGRTMKHSRALILNLKETEKSKTRVLNAVKEN